MSSADRIKEEVNKLEQPTDHLLTIAVDDPNTVWIVFATLAAAMGAGAFIHSLFC